MANCQKTVCRKGLCRCLSVIKTGSSAKQGSFTPPFVLFSGNGAATNICTRKPAKIEALRVNLFLYLRDDFLCPPRFAIRGHREEAVRVNPSPRQKRSFSAPILPIPHQLFGIIRVVAHLTARQSGFPRTFSDPCLYSDALFYI